MDSGEAHWIAPGTNEANVVQGAGGYRPKADVASADIEWTERCIEATPENVGVDLVGADILVPQELIDCVELLACLRQMIARECPCHAAAADRS